MPNLDRRFDVVVIGSGPAVSTAVKELTERGLEVLLLDAGRELRPEDFEPLKKKPAPMGMDLMPRAKAMAAGQFRQACRPYFGEQANRFLENDFHDPYTHPLNRPYLWIRSKLLGGRMHSYGRVLQRMSDVAFHAASLDGYGSDWPISSADLAWHDRVEESVGATGTPTAPSTHRTGSTAAQLPHHRRRTSRPQSKATARTQSDLPARQAPLDASRLASPTLKPPDDSPSAQAQVTRITTDQRTGWPPARSSSTETKREHRIYADTVMVCASAIESLRPS